MAKLIKPGDTIIGKHTDGHTRRPDWKGIKKHPILNKPMTMYECDLNSYAEIVKECDKKYIVDDLKTKNSTVGDCIQADGITIYIDTKKKETFSKESGTSGRHSSFAFKFRKLSICRIKTPLKNLEKKIAQLNQSNTLDS